MKKIFILAVALATLASCTKNASIEVAPTTEENAIGFSAYTGNAATKGNSYAVTDVVDAEKGIGVFAFYQPANGTTKQDFNSKKFATPDFMYNQQVKPETVTPAVLYTLEEYNAAKSTSLSQAQFDALPDYAKVKTPATAGSWTYSPVKYWPNNTNDQISFFAYAPYDKDKTWEDLGFQTDVNATKLTAEFPVYNEKAAMKDYLFATPALNKSKQAVAVAPSTSSADIINFNFKHIMSRVAINIGAIVDKVPADTPEAFPAPVDGTGTVITVESIVIKDIAESYDYTMPLGTTSGTAGFEAKGSQNLTLSGDDFQNSTSESWTEDKWYSLLADENSKPGYLFLAPQNYSSKKLVITYTVDTTDADNEANNSTITNVIEKEIGVNFESGSAYILNLLIGMKTVELSVSMDEWIDGGTHQIDVPANQ